MKEYIKKIYWEDIKIDIYKQKNLYYCFYTVNDIEYNKKGENQADIKYDTKIHIEELLTCI